MTTEPAILSKMALVQITTTTNSQQAAQDMARTLVQEQLAACVQIVGPIQSVYRWEGKIETGQEWRVEMKTTEELRGQLVDRTKQLHTYDVPEVIVNRIAYTDPDYLEWARRQTHP